MLIELPSGDVAVDEKPIVSDFRINITRKHQIRIKFNAIKDDKRIPLDIIIYRWDLVLPSVRKLTSVGVKFEGIENESKKRMNCTLSYKFLAKEWELIGMLGVENFNIQSKEFKRISLLFSDIFLI